MTMPTRVIFARRANANAPEATTKTIYTQKLEKARMTMSMRRMKKRLPGASVDNKNTPAFPSLVGRPSVATARAVESRKRIP